MKYSIRKGLPMQGSYTVEAALVFPLLFLIFLVLLYIVFYLHDYCVIHIYADRMVQESCRLYVENEKELTQASADEILEEVREKYEDELQGQLLITQVTQSSGSCSRNALTNVYCVTWYVCGSVSTGIDTGAFHSFTEISYEAVSQRIHIRGWLYRQMLSLQGGERCAVVL